MSDNQVDLDAMIKNDRKRKFIQKDKKRQNNQQRQKQRQRGYQRTHNTKRYDISVHTNEKKWQRRNQQRDNRRANIRDDNVIQTYAINAQGFVSDVSLDDILKLAKGKQIVNIKATLERDNHQVLQEGKDMNMSVIINFLSKIDADQFIKEYADKKIDGKNQLRFQFRRGLRIRKDKVNGDKNGGKQQEQE